MIALKKSALLEAQTLFAAGQVRKTYWALVQGVPAAAAGEMELPLAKLTAGRRWKMVPAAHGDAARTSWRRAGSGGGLGWLELHPRTGRTHQVRAHCAAIGHPVLGDAVYGGGGGPLCLLARAILLPVAPPVDVKAPVPPHMLQGLQDCGWSGDDQERV